MADRVEIHPRKNMLKHTKNAVDSLRKALRYYFGFMKKEKTGEFKYRPQI
jgi:hypothetical protein